MNEMLPHYGQFYVFSLKRSVEHNEWHWGIYSLCSLVWVVLKSLVIVMLNKN